MNVRRLLVNLVVLVVPAAGLFALLAPGKAEAPAYKTYAAYGTTVRAREFIAPDPDNPRLLTDRQFAGRSGRGNILFGIYYGNEGWNMRQVEDLERWQGKQDPVVSIITDWCNSTNAMDNLFNQQIINIWDNQNVPLISWEPYFCALGRAPDDVEVRAAAGAYDNYLNTWADHLKAFLSGPDGVYNSEDDRRVYLRFAHEMNGDWYQWGAAVGHDAPADYIRMWKRVKAIFDRKGMDPTHVQWMWCVNHTDNGPFTAEEYYPGDAFVDWVAVDGYNWGQTQSWSTWSTPAQIYGDMLHRLRRLTTKPLAIPEYATTTSTARGQDIAAKSQWIAGVHQYMLANDVRLAVWFNLEKETDWAIFGGSQGDGVYVEPPFLQRLRPWQIVGAVVIVVFVLGEVVFVTRLVT